MDYGKELRKCFCGEIPNGIVRAGKSYIKVRVSDPVTGKAKVHRITPQDVEAYYDTEAGNLTSGGRKLGSIIGDWRQIDELAELARHYFRHIGAMEDPEFD